jgi:precorrin-3B methylase
MRINQRVRLTTLQDLHRADVDMQTTVFVGNLTTFIYQSTNGIFWPRPAFSLG